MLLRSVSYALILYFCVQETMILYGLLLSGRGATWQGVGGRGPNSRTIIPKRLKAMVRFGGARGRIASWVMCFFMVASLTVFSSCKTRAVLSSKVALGMTQQEVVKICGKPYKQSARKDPANNLQEEYFYKEKIWDDVWSSDETTVNHVFVFNNGVLVAIEQAEETHNSTKRHMVVNL